MIAGGSIAAVNLLAVLFIVLRLFYGWCYITDRASLRSMVWFAATACTVGLFIVAAVGSLRADRSLRAIGGPPDIAPG